MKKIVPFTKQIHFKTMISEITDIEVNHNLVVKEDNVIEGDILVDGSYKIHEASQIEEKFHYNLPFTIEVDDKYDIENAEIGINDFYFEIINEEDLKVNVELEIRNVEERQEEIEEEVKEEIKFDDSKLPLAEEKDQLEVSLDEEVIRNHIEKIPVEINEKIESLEVPSVEEIEKDLDYNNNDELNTISINQSINQEPKISYESSVIKNNEDTNNDKINIPANKPYTNIFDTISNDETYVTYYVYIVRESDTIEYILDKYKITKDDLQMYNDLENIKVGSKVIIPCHNE